ncbi:TPA: oligosaccharide flippase family protein [Streptococcus agalactiae]|uniref:putative polysaccharide biosynthesis protein n=1 Tax=Streptococcus agalactiae TaxID=1311 RepID=UPI0002BBAE63|nr:polysaccharide biosynthesis protein [Streptococcus agalactiae]EPU99213.1 polysaccharide biosynthesis protein [Streptococcus agalactiae GB00300]EPW76164.1 polysaccharide biosynthesis protein [Streptococcus agalactiae BSU133]KLL25018.1 polysaccharide biosynthesis protein [Streptococcus agalactiae]MCY7250799.1 polysaccharide biosynthesis protein [Streptococcus agalactiae]TQC13047.1 polysaccharide biosynthesis protein [Streptococcus agalactiae]
MSQKTTKVSQQEQMVKGTAWLTAGNFISRLLGAIYIIPWYAWMGKHAAEANALFGMGYEIYALFLLISTVGIPVAVAKQVSKYNTLGKEEVSIYLVRKILQFMLILGGIFALIMYIGSPLFASLSKGGQELVPILRSLTLAVLVFPSMSVLRGFFQGFNNLKPYAISQVAEQIIRVIWMLLTAFYIMRLGSGDYIAAVTQSTFAAFVGMFASIAVLLYFLWRYNMLSALIGKTPEHIKLDTKEILIETVKEAIPFIITGAAIQIFKLIDQFSFGNTMALFTNYSSEELRVMFAYFSSNPGKVTMILIAVATAIAGVGIPLLTENFVKNDKKAAARLVVNNLQMLLMFLLPAVAGSVILAKPLYTVFYGLPQEQALGLFVISLIQTIILSIYTVLAPMLQALFENRKAIIYFLYGLVAKVILQVPSIFLFHAYGPLFSTTVALCIPVILMYLKIHEITGFKRQAIRRTSALVLILTLLMSFIISMIIWLMNLVIVPDSRLVSLVYIIVIGAIGLGVYVFMALATHLLDKMIGSRAQDLRRKLHLN